MELVPDAQLEMKLEEQAGEIETHGIDVKKVIEERLLLKGAKENGVDYTHFHFLVSQHHDELVEILEDETKSAYDSLFFFWTKFYPYLEAEVDDKANLHKKMMETAEDADDVVKMGVDMKFQLDHAKHMLQQYGLTKAYNVRLKVQEEKLLKEINRQKEDGTIK